MSDETEAVASAVAHIANYAISFNGSVAHQLSPYPHDLADLVRVCKYRKHEGWRVMLQSDSWRDTDADERVIGRGLTLVITTQGYDTYHPESGPNYRVRHYFIVPAATYNRRAWMRWLFEQFAKVELHECMENFVISEDGEDTRPFAPLHGPGEDPYTVHEYATTEQKDRRYFDHTGRD